MNRKGNHKRRQMGMLVVARASASTWAVAFSRRLIPGALFHTRTAAVRYALALASAAGLGNAPIMVLAGA
ncbi:MAG TPA: hypothetical protein VLT92_01405 [Burkholderiales bacterium]|nr:hypothetical protein [Burkholderiales bacterium]